MTEQTDVAESLRFLDLLYGTAERGWLQLWTLPDKRSSWIDTGATEWRKRAERMLGAIGPQHDTYVRMSLMPKNLGSTQRGRAEDAIAVPGVWMDLDYAEPVAHKKPNLPANAEAIMDLLDSLEMAPTVIVHSGYGIHAYWLGRELWTIDGPEEYVRMAALVQRWQEYVRGKAKERGWVVDSVHDLARVLRVPGTYNHKKPGSPVMARILRTEDRDIASIQSL